MGPIQAAGFESNRRIQPPAALSGLQQLAQSRLSQVAQGHIQSVPGRAPRHALPGPDGFYERFGCQAAASLGPTGLPEGVPEPALDGASGKVDLRKAVAVHLESGGGREPGPADEVTLEQAASVILGSLAMLALGLFGPGIATGLVSGAPQLGAGAAIGTAAGVAAGTVAGGTLAASGIRAAGDGARSAVGAAASMTGGARTAYQMNAAASGKTGAGAAAAGMSGVAGAGARAAASGARNLAGRMFGNPRDSHQAGARAAFAATGGTGPDAMC